MAAGSRSLALASFRRPRGQTTLEPVGAQRAKDTMTDRSDLETRAAAHGSAPFFMFLPFAAAAAALFAPRQDAAQPSASAPHTPAWSDVRAVLEQRCLECHGGDARKGLLSFADHTTFALGGAHGAPVDRDEPAQSLLARVIAYSDPDLSMPPSGELPADERALLDAWIAAGAPWPDDATGRLADPALHPREGGIDFAKGADWWAYRPLVAPPVPELSSDSANGAWRAHAIDRFVKSHLDERGLAPAPRASDEQLLRRVTFDLTGLPPTPLERTAFTNDVAARGFDAAWSALLDRLLAAPTHAEHFARHWLDLVRFAETNGYERDGTKTNIWRYRDFVVRAFASHMPYDEFVRLQLAGDEIAGLARDGAIDAKHADAALATGYMRLVVWDDEPADRLQAKWDEIADVVDTSSQVFLGSTLGCARCHDHKADPISQRDYYAFTAFFNNLEGYRYGGEREVADAPGPGVYTVAEHTAALEALDAQLVAEAQSSGALDAAFEEPVLLVPDARQTAHTWKYDRIDALEAAPAGWETPAFDDSEWRSGAAGFGDPSTPGSIVGTRWFTPALVLRTTFALEALPQSLVLSVHYDDDVVVYLNGAPIASRTGYVTEYQEFELGPEALSALVVGRNVLAVSCIQDFGGRYIDVGLRTGTLEEPDAVTRIANNLARSPDEPRFARARALFAERAALLDAPVAAPYPGHVVREHGARAPVQQVFGRGSAHAAGETVEPRLPEVLGFAAPSITPRFEAPPDDAPSSGRRTALADWLVTDGAFLTARVHANRLWQWCTGQALCPTPGDFGRLGEQPVNGALLDHLAFLLVANDWNAVPVMRAILSSHTYTLASTGPATSQAVDGENRSLWRAHPRRLSAESYRDSVLLVSGRLEQRLFGPSVYPPMDPAVLATASRPEEAWGESSDADARRRSLYVFVKRSLRFPLLEALDQPSPDSACPSRYLTNVPTQALMTLNGPFTGEAALALARRLESEQPGDTPADVRARITMGIELALSRTPAADEVERQVQMLERLAREHTLSPGEALDVWCLGLFNRNEFMWVD